MPEERSSEPWLLLRYLLETVAVVDRDGVVLFVTEEPDGVLGASAESFTGVQVFEFVHPDDRERVVAAFEECVRTPGSSVTGEYRLPHADGSWQWMETKTTNLLDDPLVGGVLIASRNITPQVTAFEDAGALVEHYADLALRDELTGLPNRRLLQDRLCEALKRLHRHPRRLLAVLLLDLDQLKELNDTHGHAVGDAVLVEVARRLEAAARPADTVCRFGGDEFVVLCEDLASPEDAAAIAKRQCAALGEPFRVGDGPPLALGASVGVAMTDDAASEPEALLAAADAAMYAVKRDGGSGWAFAGWAGR